MYEIHEDRTVTHDGKVADESVSFHYASVDSDGGRLTVRLADYNPEIGFLKPVVALANGELGFETKELLAALMDLAQLAGLSPAATQEMAMAVAQERAAAVVERACYRLESSNDPVDQTLASDLRATMLQLIHLATTPSS